MSNSHIKCKYNCCQSLRLSGAIDILPPASEGWGKVIFSVCSHLWGGGYPIPGLLRTLSQVCGWGGYPIPGLGGVPHLKSGWGVPHPRSWWGVPHPRSGWGGTPSQVWVGGTPSQVWMVGGVPRVPLTRSGWWGGTWGTPGQV